jgi:hypothetical protein
MVAFLLLRQRWEEFTFELDNVDTALVLVGVPTLAQTDMVDDRNDMMLVFSVVVGDSEVLLVSSFLFYES